MLVYAYRTLNQTAQQVPGVSLQINPPQTQVVNGVPTNNLGIVGTALWAPKNKPVIVGSPSQCQAVFGPLQNRKYDLRPVVVVAALQGANAMTCVRVTDDTDTAASAAGSYKVTVAARNLPVEVFDSITGSGNALWIAIANAVNAGQSGLRGPSQVIMAVAGSGTGFPTASASTLSGRTDGAATITASALVGADTSPRTSMYCASWPGAVVQLAAWH